MFGILFDLFGILNGRFDIKFAKYRCETKELIDQSTRTTFLIYVNQAKEDFALPKLLTILFKKQYMVAIQLHGAILPSLFDGIHLI